MGFDGIAEQEAIEARLRANLLSGRIYTELPEEATLAVDPSTRLVKPYILLTFGSLYASADDRTMMGEEEQPQVMPVIIECWASNAKAARRTAAGVRKLFLGWAPDDNNATPMEMRGGGWFPGRSNSAGRPSRSMESVNFITVLNQSTLEPEVSGGYGFGGYGE